MQAYVGAVKLEVALKYQQVVNQWYDRFRQGDDPYLYDERNPGVVLCQGWRHRLCPLGKLVRQGRVRCLHCWRQLRDAQKAETAAQKAVDDVWNKFKTSPEFPVISDPITPDDEPKADASDPLAAHKLATMLGARGECGFETFGKDKGRRLDKMNEESILYETVSRLAYIADCNVITRQEVKAASRCGGLPVRPPYLLPRSAMPNVADTEDDVYLTFLQKLQSMTSEGGWATEEGNLRAKTFFDASNMEKVRCCKAALAAACVAHNKAQGIDACSLKPACFEGGVCAAGNLSTSE